MQVASRSRRIPSFAKFRSWVRAAAYGHASDVDVTIRLAGTSEARRLNQAYRGRDYATNVLTFAYDRARADVVLCPQVVVREAREQEKTLVAHYAHLTVHAILHLRGYDHQACAEATRMERQEILILGRLGIANPYAG